MYKLCKTEQSSARQREIEQMFLSLMLEKHYDDITVTEICLRAGIPRKSFYRYFDGKEGVRQSLIHHTFEDFDVFRTNISSDVNTLRSEFESVFVFWKTKEDLLRAFDKGGMTGSLIEYATTYAMGEFADVQSYLFDSDMNDKILSFQFVICGLVTMAVNWYRSGFKESVQNMARTATKISTRPLFENLSRTQ